MTIFQWHLIIFDEFLTKKSDYFDDFSMQCADFKLIFDEIWWFLIFSESNLMSDIFRLSLYPQSIDINVIPTECTENRCKSNRRYLDATIQRAKLPHKGSLPVSRCKLLMFDDFSIHFDDFWGSFDDIWWFFITFRLNLMILDNFPITFDTCWRFFNQIWLFLMIFPVCANWGCNLNSRFGTF